MPKNKIFIAAFAILSFLLRAEYAEAKGAVAYFKNKFSVSVQRNDKTDYDINLASHPFFVFMPSNYTGREAFGLISYTSAAPQFTELPPGWENVLSRNKLILIAPQGAGNETNGSTRMGLNVLGTLAACQYYKIDRNRIYAAGFSGGARIASHLAFLQPDLYKGTIQSCGSDFYREVIRQYAPPDPGGSKYGVTSVPANLVSVAKANVKFAIITGANDFRYGNLKDIYQNGFYRDGFKARLFDIPQMEHVDCDENTLDQAIRYLDGR